MPEFRLLKKFGSSPGTLLDFGQINGVARRRVFGLRGFGTSLFRNAGTVLEEERIQAREQIPPGMKPARNDKG